MLCSFERTGGSFVQICQDGKNLNFRYLGSFKFVIDGIEFEHPIEKPLEAFHN